MSDKLTQKELKAPDAFQKVGVEAQSWLQENQRTVAMAVAGVLALGAVAALVSYFGGRTDKQSSQALGLALKDIDRPVAEDPEKVAQPEPGEEAPFKTAQEKEQALLTALSEYRKAHPAGSPSGNTAALAAGQAAYKLGKHDEALAAFDEFLKNTTPEEPLRASALEGQGYAYEAKGELDRALTAFEALGRERTDFLAGMGLYHQARILIQQNKKEEAARKLSELTATNPGSAAARLAADRLSLLAAEGIRVGPVAMAADAG